MTKDTFDLMASNIRNKMVILIEGKEFTVLRHHHMNFKAGDGSSILFVNLHIEPKDFKLKMDSKFINLVLPGSVFITIVEHTEENPSVA